MGFPKSSPTNNGKKLLLQALAGEQLQFSTIKIGDGKFTANTDIAALTGLINELHSFNIASIKKEADSVTLYAPFDSREVSESFEFREIGVYAIDPETKQEVLYSYTNCGEEAEKIEGVDVDFVEKTLKIIVAVNDAENVIITINSDLNYLTKAEYKDDWKKYDSNGDGIIDEADNSKKFNGHEESYFAKVGDIPTKIDELDETDSKKIMTYEERIKLDGIESGATKTIVDTVLNSKSTNPIQNKVVTDKLTPLVGSYRGNEINLGEDVSYGIYENDYFSNLGFKPSLIIISSNLGHLYLIADTGNNSSVVANNFDMQPLISVSATFSENGVTFIATNEQSADVSPKHIAAEQSSDVVYMYKIFK